MSTNNVTPAPVPASAPDINSPAPPTTAPDLSSLTQPGAAAAVFLFVRLQMTIGCLTILAPHPVDDDGRAPRASP
jgi:hypothetical protein